MAIGGDTAPWRLRIYCNAGRQGWSEVYWLVPRVLPDALAASYDLCNRRRLLFGAGCSIIYACICQGDACVDSYAVMTPGIATFPPNLTPQPQPPNADLDGWAYRLEAPGGRYTTRLLHGVPDNWVSGYMPSGPMLRMGPLGRLPPITLGAAAPGDVQPLLLGPGGSLLELQRSFLDAIMAYTGFLTQPTPPPVTPYYETEQITRVVFRSVSTREEGHAWRPMSAESLGERWRFGYADPDFSFCGMMLGVARTTYSQQCRWAIDGPVSLIRFYYVPSTNPIYYGRLRFGPKISEPGYRNLNGVGEITRFKRIWYVGTNHYPARDGTHPDVTAEQAAGQEQWLPEWDQGLPGDLLPACDYPAGPPPAMFDASFGVRPAALARQGAGAAARLLLEVAGTLDLAERYGSHLAPLLALSAAPILATNQGSRLDLLPQLAAAEVQQTAGLARLDLLPQLAAAPLLHTHSHGLLPVLLPMSSLVILEDTLDKLFAATFPAGTGLSSSPAAHARLAVLLPAAAGTAAGFHAGQLFRPRLSVRATAKMADAAGHALGAKIGFRGGAQASFHGESAVALVLALANSASEGFSGVGSIQTLFSTATAADLDAAAAALLALLPGLRAGLTTDDTAAARLGVLLGLAQGVSLSEAAGQSMLLLPSLAVSSGQSYTASARLRTLLGTAGGVIHQYRAGQLFTPVLSTKGGFMALTEAEGRMLTTLALAMNANTITAAGQQLMLALALKAGNQQLTEAQAHVLTLFGLLVDPSNTFEATARLDAELELALADLVKMEQGQQDASKPPGKISVQMNFVSFGMDTPAGGCGSLPTNVVIRFSGGSAGVSGINGQSAAMAWNATFGQWAGAIGGGTYAGKAVGLSCVAGTWTLTFPTSGLVGTGTLTGTSGPTPSLTGTCTFPSPSGTCTATLTRT